MKAYQLKIAIKNSKPPIWRRCIIPAGITFSQLSIVLNEIMGWCGAHLSQFEFYHRKLQLMEDDGFDYFAAPWDYDLLDSAKTYIDEFMESEEWFTYVYDFGDWWAHRVTIEKIIEDYEYNYANVLKYKGDCPPEDIGGIDMYYAYLDGKYEDITGFSPEEIPTEIYDIDSINETLCKDYFVNWQENGETRLARDIYEDVWQGKGLIGCTNPVNEYEQLDVYDDEVYNLSEDDNFIITEKDLKKFQQIFEENKLDISEYIENWFEKQSRQRTLNSCLIDFTKDDLIDLGEQHGLNIKSWWNKEKMAQVISESILKPEEFKRNISRLDEVEIKAFEKAINNIGYIMKKDEYILYNRLYGLGYALITVDNEVDVPSDIKELYKSINTKEFKNNRKYSNWINKCVVYLQYYYGCAPLSIMVKLANKKEHISINVDQLQEKLLDFTDKVTIVGENLVANELFETGEYEKFMEWQGKNKTYYVPTADEIEYFYNNLSYMPSEYDLEMIKFIEKICQNHNEAVLTEQIIQRMVYNEESMQEVINLLEESEIYFGNEKDFSEFVHLFNNLWNNTRLLANKGHTPNEIASTYSFKNGKLPTIVPVSSNAAKLLEDSKVDLENRGLKIDLDSTAQKMDVVNVTSNGEIISKREKKVYPNDPCPCGSGKKFKKCCGR